MALADELKDYITKNAKTSTTITQNHNVAIVGETHARLSSEEPNISNHGGGSTAARVAQGAPLSVFRQ